MRLIYQRQRAKAGAPASRKKEFANRAKDRDARELEKFIRGALESGLLFFSLILIQRPLIAEIFKTDM